MIKGNVLFCLTMLQDLYLDKKIADVDEKLLRGIFYFSNNEIVYSVCKLEIDCKNPEIDEVGLTLICSEDGCNFIAAEIWFGGTGEYWKQYPNFQPQMLEQIWDDFLNALKEF